MFTMEIEGVPKRAVTFILVGVAIGVAADLVTLRDVPSPTHMSALESLVQSEKSQKSTALIGKAEPRGQFVGSEL